MGTFAISVFALIRGCSTCLGLWSQYLSCKALCQRKYKIDTFNSLVGEHLTLDQSVIRVGWRQLKEEEAHLSQRRSRAEAILPCHKWKNGQLLCTVAFSWIQATTTCFLQHLRSGLTVGSTVRDPDESADKWHTADTQTVTLSYQGSLCAFRPSSDAALSLRLKNRENNCL